MTFIIYNVNTGEVLEETNDPQEAWDILVEIEEETMQDCAIRESKEE